MGKRVYMHEIGSEYEYSSLESGTGIVFPDKFDGSLTLSGRTAIEAVLRVLDKKKKAVFPSYCCESLIEPFTKAGIEIDFYNVYYDDELKIDVDIPDNTDIFVWCNYFGFINTMPDLSDFKQKGGIIIEDITHSLLSDYQYNTQSNYLVASVRKWEPIICGGYCSIDVGYNAPPDYFVTGRKRAMQLKSRYLKDLDEKKKESYLSEFSKLNKWRNDNYSCIGIDPFSKDYLEHVDVNKQREVRRRNAHLLYKGLEDKIQFLYPEERMDCPLFVPIIAKNRTEIRQKLIDNKIYCPIHWPKPKNKCESNLYDLELSLICDQRYKEDDMERIISVLDN